MNENPYEKMAKAIRKNPGANLDPKLWDEVKAYNKKRNKWFNLIYVELFLFIAIAIYCYFLSH